MTTVSINSSQTTAIRAALADGLTSANLAGTKMATGDAIIHAYEDGPSWTIGENMKQNVNVKKIAYGGIEQSQSMFYIAEYGIKSIYDTVSQMKEILAQAKLGYMTDDLIKTTLSPTYVQLKQEINRIADSINFNGKTLLNGQSGSKNAGTASSKATTTASYVSNGNSATTLAAFMTNDITVSAGIVTGGTPGDITFAVTANGVAAPTVSGGTIITEANGDVIVSGAQLLLTGITATDKTAPTAKTATGNLVVDNVTITFKVGEFDYTNGAIKSKTGKAPVVSELTYADLSFTPTDSGGGLNAISDFKPSSTAGATPITPLITTGDGSSISNLTAEYAISGGIPATSGFSLVTGSDLRRDVVILDMPNLRLTKSNDVLGMMDTLNTTAPKKSTDLTDLRNTADADTDIPLVEQLLDDILGNMNVIGAYETKIINIIKQLQSDIAELDNAQGVFLNADLTEVTAAFTTAIVKINIAIATLKQLNSVAQALQQLVV